MTCKKLICALFALLLCLQLASCAVTEKPNDGRYDTSTDVSNIASGKKSYSFPTSADTTFAYSGSEIRFVPTGFDSNAMNISGNTATEVGEYTAAISLKDPERTLWSDGTTDDVYIIWSITKEPTDYAVTKISDGKLNVVSIDGENNYSADIVYPLGATYQLSKGGRLTFFYDQKSDDAIQFEFVGSFCGSIAFDINQDTDLEIDLCGFETIAYTDCPIYISSAANADISAKKDTENKITDKRSEVTELKSAVYSDCDLKLKGSGKLTVVSDNNNGINSKDDLDIQKLTLYVSSVDNALKGNDGVRIKSGELTLISRKGDGIKTSNSDVSSKGNQKGDVVIEDGKIDIFAACDGIDAAHDVLLEGGEISILTDKYSEYSEEVTAVTEGTYYIRATSDEYAFSICYKNSSGDTLWVNTDGNYKTINAGPEKYYYYSVQKPSGYDTLAVYVYKGAQKQGQAENYYKASEEMPVNSSYDTIAFGRQMRPGFGSKDEKFEWTNYGTDDFGGGPGGPGGPGGFGGMNDGNTDKGDHSTKGIKSANEITINDGIIMIRSYDDSLHANNDIALDSGKVPLGNVTVNGGTLTLSSNDDAIHADGTATITGGTVDIKTSYEGIEGNNVVITGGDIAVVASDDGINGTATDGESIAVLGGTLYVYAGGDGVDSNSRSSYDGILFAGGNSVIISTGRGDSAIDTERGYQYTGGTVVAVGAMGGMQNETMNCRNFNLIASGSSVNLSASSYLTVDGILTLKMPCTLSSYVVVLGKTNARIASAAQTTATLDKNGVCWGE